MVDLFRYGDAAVAMRVVLCIVQSVFAYRAGRDGTKGRRVYKLPFSLLFSSSLGRLSPRLASRRELLLLPCALAQKGRRACNAVALGRRRKEEEERRPWENNKKTRTHEKVKGLQQWCVVVVVVVVVLNLRRCCAAHCVFAYCNEGRGRRRTRRITVAAADDDDETARERRIMTINTKHCLALVVFLFCQF